VPAFCNYPCTLVLASLKRQRNAHPAIHMHRRLKPACCMPNPSHRSLLHSVWISMWLLVPHSLSYITSCSPSDVQPASQERLPRHTMFQAVPQSFTSQQAPSPPIDHMHSIPEAAAIMASRPNGQPKPRKMRASCDACSRAKVRMTVSSMMNSFADSTTGQVRQSEAYMPPLR